MPDDLMAQARKQAERPLSLIRAALAGLPELPEIQCKQRRPPGGFDRNRER
jgi:hypothetical protein